MIKKTIICNILLLCTSFIFASVTKERDQNSSSENVSTDEWLLLLQRVEQFEKKFLAKIDDLDSRLKKLERKRLVSFKENLEEY